MKSIWSTAKKYKPVPFSRYFFFEGLEQKCYWGCIVGHRGKNARGLHARLIPHLSLEKIKQPCSNFKVYFEFISVSREEKDISCKISSAYGIYPPAEWTTKCNFQSALCHCQSLVMQFSLMPSCSWRETTLLNSPFKGSFPNAFTFWKAFFCRSNSLLASN